MLCFASLQGSHFTFCLFMEQTEPGHPGFSPLQDCIRFYLCHLGEMSLIKHSLSSAGRAVFIGKGLLPWPVGTELGSSAGCRGDGQPFCWPEPRPFLVVVVWEECGYTDGKTCTRLVFVEVASASQAHGPQSPSPLPGQDVPGVGRWSRSRAAAGPDPKPWRASAFCCAPLCSSCSLIPQIPTCSCWYSCLFPAPVPMTFSEAPSTRKLEHSANS